LITVATTNDLSQIDYALTNRPGRFDRKLVIPLPGKTARALMLKRFIEARKARVSKSVTKAVAKFVTGKEMQSNWDLLLDNTEGYTGAYLMEVVNTAVIEAVNQNSLTNKKKPLLKSSHLLEAMRVVEENFNIGQQVTSDKEPDSYWRDSDPASCRHEAHKGETHKPLDVVKEKNKEYEAEEMKESLGI
jgi:SpoVK/Ycf46/Vps4 family AAA+-type ATPase